MKRVDNEFRETSMPFVGQMDPVCGDRGETNLPGKTVESSLRRDIPDTGRSHGIMLCYVGKRNMSRIEVVDRFLNVFPHFPQDRKPVLTRLWDWEEERLQQENP